jgi:hydrogenase maturation factor
MSKRSSDKLLDLLVTHPVVVLDDLKRALGNASRATVFRYLANVPYRRSYNHNGRYYSLHDPDGYDQYGLRSHGDIYFSRDGALNATVRRLVEEAAAGRTHRELAGILRVRVQPFLKRAVEEHELWRESIAGQYVYLHVDVAIRKVQLERRRQLVACEQVAAELTDAVVIEVLLVLVRHPGSGVEEVVRRLHRLHVTQAQVEAVFTRYELGEHIGCHASQSHNSD